MSEEKKKESFVSLFTKLKAELPEAFELDGDCMLVEEIDQENMKKSKGGIIMSSGASSQVNSLATNLPVFVRVLFAGDGFVDKEGEDVPVDAFPGQIVLVGTHSVRWFSAFGLMHNYGSTRIGIARSGDIQGRFADDSAFNAVFDLLNGDTYAQV